MKEFGRPTPPQIKRRTKTALTGEGLVPIKGFEGATLAQRAILGNPGELLREILDRQAKVDAMIKQELGQSGSSEEVVIYQAADGVQNEEII